MPKRERCEIVARGLLPIDFGESDVIRTLNEGDAIRRQRRSSDGNTFWTLELPITPPLKVISDHGERRTFDPDVIRRDIKSVYHKIPVDDETLDEVCAQITFGVAKIGIERGYVSTLDIKSQSLEVLDQVSPLLRLRYLVTFCPEVPDEIIFTEFERALGLKPEFPTDGEHLKVIHTERAEVEPEEIDKPSLGETIRAIRKSRGLSLTTLSYSVGVDISYISRIENNEITGSLRVINSIAQVLNCSLFDLLKIAGKIEIDGMSEEDTAKLKEMIDSGKMGIRNKQ